jgi:amino acid transporter
MCLSKLVLSWPKDVVHFEHKGHVFHNTKYTPQTPHHNPFAPDGKLGTFSAINIILGKTVGVAICSVPSSIFNSVGSVGASLLLWIIGSIISFCGLAVYLDLGTALPKSGGERVYLERIFRRPRMLATCIFMSYVVLLGFSTPNCIVLGEYVMYALEIQVNRWNVRMVAVAVVTLLCFIHARYQKLGLRIINVLRFGKMLILFISYFPESQEHSCELAHPAPLSVVAA